MNNLTAKVASRLQGTTPHTIATGDEGDISNLCQYAWYEWCYFRKQTAAFPNNKEVLRRVLDPARGAGNEMAQCILKANGRVVPRRSLRPLKVDEIHSPAEIKKREVFDELIERRWCSQITPSNIQKQNVFKSTRILINKNSQHWKLKTLWTQHANLSTSSQHMIRLSILKSNCNLVKK